MPPPDTDLGIVFPQHRYCFYLLMIEPVPAPWYYNIQFAPSWAPPPKLLSDPINSLVYSCLHYTEHCERLPGFWDEFPLLQNTPPCPSLSLHVLITPIFNRNFTFCLLGRDLNVLIFSCVVPTPLGRPTKPSIVPMVGFVRHLIGSYCNRSN